MEPVPDVVLRKAGPWSATVLTLLRHFEAVGFTGCPRVVGTGFDAHGHETVSYVDGTSLHPGPWHSADDLFAIGAMLRAAHEAARTFRLADLCWQPWFGRGLRRADPVIGHCDPGPWNILRTPDDGFALIDWEFAGPTDAVIEVAHAAWLNAQLHDDDIAELRGLPGAATRARYAAALLDGYGLPHRARTDFVDTMIEVAVRSARAEAEQNAVTIDSVAAIAPTGYPVLWAVTWRVRSAAWLLDHRHLLQRAVSAR
jgi:hypothetical protein